MSFLGKIGLKHKDASADIPPPPPMPSAPTPEEPVAEEPLPAEPTSEITDLPSRSSLPEVPEPPEMPQEQELPELPTDVPTPEEIAETLGGSPEQLPASSEPEEPPMPAPSEPEADMPPPAPEPMQATPAIPEDKKLSREELRAAFSDVPPIKAKPSQQAQVTNESVKSFDVNEFVLPGEDNSAPVAEEPAPAVAPQSAPMPRPSAESSVELYIPVSVYDDIQQRVGDLKKQVTAAGGEIDDILADRDKEDEAFALFIKDLERIQEDLIKIDEDLFTHQ